MLPEQHHAPSTSWASSSPASEGQRLFGGAVTQRAHNRKEIAAQMLPYLRGALATQSAPSATTRIAEDALRSPISAWGPQLSQLGTSCPDHFLRTRIRPMFVDWNPKRTVATLARSKKAPRNIAATTADYYQKCAEQSSRSCAMQILPLSSSPAWACSLSARTKREARITSEFFINAIHVMAGAARWTAAPHPILCRRRNAGTSKNFKSHIQLRGSAAHSKHSASNIGRLKKQSCSACLPNRNSAARSSWSSAEAAALAAPSR